MIFPPTIPTREAVDRLPQDTADALTQIPPPACGPAAVQVTAAQYRERNRRRDIMEAMSAYQRRHPEASVAAACRYVGVSHATFGRWRTAYQTRGEDGLIPATHLCG